VRRHSLFQPPDECLKINVPVFIPQFRFRARLYGSLLLGLVGTERVATTERERGEKKK